MENRSNYTYRYRAPLPERESGAFCDWTKRAALQERKKERREEKEKKKAEAEKFQLRCLVAFSASFVRENLATA